MNSYAHLGYEPEVIEHRRPKRIGIMPCSYNLGALGLLSVAHDSALREQLHRLEHDAVFQQAGRAEQLLAKPKQLPRKRKPITEKPQ
jgi:hypothetical protein